MQIASISGGGLGEIQRVQRKQMMRVKIPFNKLNADLSRCPSYFIFQRKLNDGAFNHIQRMSESTHQIHISASQH